MVNGKLTKSEREQLVMGANHILGGLEVKVVLATMKEGGTEMRIGDFDALLKDIEEQCCNDCDKRRQNQ